MKFLDMSKQDIYMLSATVVKSGGVLGVWMLNLIQ